MQRLPQGAAQADEQQHEAHQEKHRQRIQGPPEHGDAEGRVQQELHQHRESPQGDEAAAQDVQAPMGTVSHGIAQQHDLRLHEQGQGAARREGEGQKPAPVGFQADIEAQPQQGRRHGDGEENHGIAAPEPERETAADTAPADRSET